MSHSKADFRPRGLVAILSKYVCVHVLDIYRFCNKYCVTLEQVDAQHV